MSSSSINFLILTNMELNCPIDQSKKDGHVFRKDGHLFQKDRHVFQKDRHLFQKDRHLFSGDSGEYINGNESRWRCGLQALITADEISQSGIKQHSCGVLLYSYILKKRINPL